MSATADESKNTSGVGDVPDLILAAGERVVGVGPMSPTQRWQDKTTCQ